MPNSNPVCRPPLSSCAECFGTSEDVPEFLQLIGPPPIDQILGLQHAVGGYYEWFTISGEGWPHSFSCATDCDVLLTDGVVYQYKKCADGSCNPIQYNFELGTGDFSVSEA